jgi:hypothetical protein
MINVWREISTTVKVQASFNSKKMRKIFEPRMAHTANVIGNYIVVFGGYNSLSGVFSPNNYYILSLSGCTDFIFPKPCTLDYIKQMNMERVLKAREEKRKNENFKI